MILFKQNSIFIEYLNLADPWHFVLGENDKRGKEEWKERMDEEIIRKMAH